MDIKLLQKYLQNNCTPEESRIVLQYLATDEGQQQLQTLLENDLATLQPSSPTADDQQRAEQLFSQIQARKSAKLYGSFYDVATPDHSRNVFGQRWTWLVAATVSLLLLATGTWWLTQRNEADTWYTERTKYGQIRRIVLPDQSVITMNGNSSIRYVKDWQATTPREVWVDGEAFFEVVHTKNHQPFRVHLPDQMNVEVLGTRFNVYTRSKATKVVLNEGHIQLQVADNQNNHLDMKPGEMFFADKQNKVFYKKIVNAQAHSSWRTDKLIFDGTTLAEIATLLHDTYGLDVQIRDQKLSNQKFSGTIPSKNVATILKGLSGLFNLTITQQNNQVIIE
ncbi:hypothetical protein GCM10028807_40960 [Spirosoma daeguense]